MTMIIFWFTFSAMAATDACNHGYLGCVPEVELTAAQEYFANSL